MPVVTLICMEYPKTKYKTMKKPSTFIWISLLSVALGLFECIVVIYLRKLYYPGGFHFPLAIADRDVMAFETLREAATLIILLSVGLISGRSLAERFGWFIYSFAIWDIFYYIFLKILVGWPESCFTWDILFLIPVTWIGPVIAPVINSVSMIILAWLILEKKYGKKVIIIRPLEWISLIAGAILVITSYTIDYIQYILKAFPLSDLVNPAYSRQVAATACSYIPVHFPWWIFITGVLIHLGVIVAISLRKFYK